VLLLYNIIINTTVVRSSFLESKNLPHFASFEQEKDKTFSNGISNSSFFISRRGLLHTRFESASSAVTTATRTTTHTTKEIYLRRRRRRMVADAVHELPSSIIVHPTRGQLHHTNPLVPVGWQHPQIASSSCNNKAFGLDDFHDSLLETILSFMDAETILLTGQTCKRLHALCEREELWAALVNTRFGHRPNRTIVSSEKHQKQKRSGETLEEEKRFCIVKRLSWKMVYKKHREVLFALFRGNSNGRVQQFGGDFFINHANELALPPSNSSSANAVMMMA
tara:strand:- start:807 stop:1646 length:840 start_codon:yes stop_codon:yes gene_type:complete